MSALSYLSDVFIQYLGNNNISISTSDRNNYVRWTIQSKKTNFCFAKIYAKLDSEKLFTVNCNVHDQTTVSSMFYTLILYFIFIYAKKDVKTYIIYKNEYKNDHKNQECFLCTEQMKQGQDEKCLACACNENGSDVINVMNTLYHTNIIQHFPHLYDLLINRQCIVKNNWLTKDGYKLCVEETLFPDRVEYINSDFHLYEKNVYKGNVEIGVICDSRPTDDDGNNNSLNIIIYKNDSSCIMNNIILYLLQLYSNKVENINVISYDECSLLSSLKFDKICYTKTAFPILKKFGFFEKYAWKSSYEKICLGDYIEDFANHILF